MGLSLSDLRFHAGRGLGLMRRGLASVRTRGLRVSLERAWVQLRPIPAAQRTSLFFPSPEAPIRFDMAAAPRASIVIPVFNQLAHTRACLQALAMHPPATSFEVIVVDDCSSDDTQAALSEIDGLRYHRRARNGGFISACNEGASLARGDVLVFLNNDTIPQPGWLEALLATFATRADVGLVGAQLLYPDGRLQEAGGVVFSDGSGWNYGRFESPNDPRYAHVRDADYCSGAALAVPRATFEQLGGFDTRYAPAYYEDTDLAFAVRAAGLATLYQPASRVVHVEGATSGTDLGSGPKAYQVRNRGVLADKWQAAMRAQPAPGTPIDRAARHRSARQVLIIDSMTPRPDRDSASLRQVNLMALLRDEGAHVAFLPADRLHAGDATTALQQAGVEAWYAPYFDSPSKWLAAHGPRFDTVLVCRHYVLSDFLPLLRRHAPQARVVFDTIDLHYLREQRGAQLDGDVRGQRAAARTRALELEMVRRADHTLVVSEVERAQLTTDAPGARIEVLSNLHRIAGAGLPFEQRHDLVFVGGFRHPPNVDAVTWFVRDVFPLLRTRLPGVRLHCIGGDVPPMVAALAASDVLVHGHVPDITPYMDGCRVALAPLRYGAGVKGKVNLSMAHGQPVVATHCAVEGMHLRDREDVLIADEPASFADAVVAAYTDAVLWQTLARNGMRNVEQHFSLDAARDVVRRVLLGQG